MGSHRLLILDGHESHKSLAFQDLCEENKIITLCMPPHASHILQPLDVGCFAPLKRAYKKEINVLANSHINHIDKKAFLTTFTQVFGSAFLKENIISSFRATGLVPHNPGAVLLKLEVKPRTPSPPLPGLTTWQPRTPSNAIEIEAQSALISNRIQRHHSSSPASIIKIIRQFKKGADIIVHFQVLLVVRVADLEAANRAASERRKRKKKRIQDGGTLSQVEAEAIVEQRDVDGQFEKEARDRRLRAGGSRGSIRRCKTCGETGHNKRTC